MSPLQPGTSFPPTTRIPRPFPVYNQKQRLVSGYINYLSIAKAKAGVMYQVKPNWEDIHFDDEASCPLFHITKGN